METEEFNAFDNGTNSNEEMVIESGGDDFISGAPDSPRTIWFRENQLKLEEKEEDEKNRKMEIQDKAKGFLQDFYETRQNKIEETKEKNRMEEQDLKEAQDDMDGSIWDQTIKMINFSLGVQQKDVSRFRAMLFKAREVDLPLKQ